MSSKEAYEAARQMPPAVVEGAGGAALASEMTPQQINEIAAAGDPGRALQLARDQFAQTRSKVHM